MFMGPVPGWWMDGGGRSKSLFVTENTTHGKKDEARVVHILAYDASLIVYNFFFGASRYRHQMH